MNAALRRMGHQVDEFWADALGRRIRHGNLHYLLELPSAYRREVRRRVMGVDYDIIELNQPHAYLAAADLRKRNNRAVFVNRSHGHEVRVREVLESWGKESDSPRASRLWRAASTALQACLDRHWAIIVKNADGFIVSCCEDRDFLMHRYSVAVEQVGVISQGIPDVFSTDVRPLDERRLKRLLYVGQFAFVKAPMMLARVVASLLDACPDASMTWVCSSLHHEHVQRLIPTSVRPRVQLVDWMSQDALIAAYDEHGVFLFPSFFEGFGKAPMEAMARGMCVIASDTGGMRDYIKNGTNGFLVPVGRPDLMARCAMEAMHDPDRFAAVSAAARDAACRHTWDRCAADATAFYERLLALKGRR
jgi:glycosyltransferase involved in cell wall biosynthesis